MLTLIYSYHNIASPTAARDLEWENSLLKSLTTSIPHPPNPTLTAMASIPDRPTGFPTAMFVFPRSDWSGVAFAWPQFEDWDDGPRVNYAARECSLAWEVAIEDEDISALGVADFALAVFDKVDELCVPSSSHRACCLKSPPSHVRVCSRANRNKSVWKGTPSAPIQTRGSRRQTSLSHLSTISCVPC